MIGSLSKKRPPLPGGPYLVVGLARSGQAAARLLAARGEPVIGIDSGSPEGAAGLEGEGVEVLLDVVGAAEVERGRCVVKSPGVPSDAAPIALARRRGLPVIGELELAWRLMPNRFLAVTGTNGKTTVTELLAHVWRCAAEPVAVAGNIGTPLASLVGELDRGVTVICEASSFQLEDTEAFAPECGVLLNLSADHLDRHPDLHNYLGAKLKVFANQGPDDIAIVNGDLVAVDTGSLPAGRKLRFCDGGTGYGPAAGEPAAGPFACDATVTDGAIWWKDERLLGTEELRLLGPHNALNAAAALAAALSWGLDRDAVRDGLRTFGAVAHRLEPVATLGGVLYVNDSKATNVAAATEAIGAFDRPVRAILGGSLKGASFAELAAPVAERCVAAYLIGAAAAQLERELAPAWQAGVEHRRCDGLAEAVRAAAADAAAGEVVLLAPACASFDAYRDFEARGEHFRAVVGELG